MDQDSQVFSHQLEVVNLLANEFDKVMVLTAHSGKFQVAANVQVISFEWIEGKRVRSLMRFYRRFFHIIFSRNISVIFSHMTSVQSAFISPITRAIGLKHYLWYAHASNNIYFKVAKLFSNGIITSTEGSCPAKGKQIFPIGQAIDSVKFAKKSRRNYPLSKFVHIGRLDPSKNLEEIIKVINKLRTRDPNITLEIIGSPSSEKHRKYAEELMSIFSEKTYSDWLKFTPKISRDLIPKVLREKDCFIHSFQGSLDKTIVEATFAGLPVITINAEYLKMFGIWSDYRVNAEVDLQVEAQSLLELDVSSLDGVIEERHKIAQEHHDLQSWIVKLVGILKYG
jgi:glycosyltransferase involved in cell wall biosynthesis